MTIRANELMIGDWVMLTNRINNGEIVQVKEIHGDGCITVDGAITKMFEPIPLTEEILEKNGFIQKQSEFINGDMGVIFTIRGFSFWSKKTIEIACGNGSRINNLPRYVHQLQHVLRLCNIEKEIEL